MNLYVDLINDTVDFIEDNIREKMTLEDISNRFCVSEFHFNRMFRTVSGTTLKQYILGRKLSRALEYLSGTREPVIDIAYDFGFEYPEVFSRAFKKQFGVSPTVFRRNRPKLEPVKKACIVERDIISYQGSMTLKGIGVLLEELELKGMFVEVDVNKPEFREVMQSSADSFLAEARQLELLDKQKLYTVVNCHGEDNGEYTVFYGMKTAALTASGKLSTRVVPGGPYERFVYCGDMFDIREAFIDDLYRWVMVKEIELEQNGVGMLNIFDSDYSDTREVQILVPVKTAADSKKNHEA